MKDKELKNSQQTTRVQNGTSEQQNIRPETFVTFMEKSISQLRMMGKARTSDIYKCTLSSFLRFSSGKDISFSDIDTDLIMRYEAHLLRDRGITRNSSSFYLRTFRATYNRAVAQGLTHDRHPFRYVYTGIDKTTKRALPLQLLRRIATLDLTSEPNLEKARDLFLFSFYTRGMSFVDMAYLKKSDIANGTLVYRRRKTGQILQIKWEKCMQDIVDKYDNDNNDYLLPIINKENINKRQQYLSSIGYTNILLKKIGFILDLQLPLTTYVARHSWANIARFKNVPISIISEGMGHNSESTTRIYLSSLETHLVDNANSTILDALLNNQ